MANRRTREPEISAEKKQEILREATNCGVCLAELTEEGKEVEMIVTSRRGGDRTDKKNMRVICSDCTEHRLCHVRVPIGLYRKIKGNEASFAEVVRECLIKFLHENKDEEYNIRQSEEIKRILAEMAKIGHILEQRDQGWLNKP